MENKVVIKLALGESTNTHIMKAGSKTIVNQRDADTICIALDEDGGEVSHEEHDLIVVEGGTRLVKSAQRIQDIASGLTQNVRD